MLGVAVGLGSDGGRLLDGGRVKGRLELEHGGVRLGTRGLADLDYGLAGRPGDAQLEGDIVAGLVVVGAVVVLDVHGNIRHDRLVERARLLRPAVRPAVHALDVAQGAGADADPLVAGVQLLSLEGFVSPARQHEAAQLVDGVLEAGLAVLLAPAPQRRPRVRRQRRLEGVQPVEAEQGQALGREEDLVLAHAPADHVAAVEAARRQ